MQWSQTITPEYVWLRASSLCRESISLSLCQAVTTIACAVLISGKAPLPAWFSVFLELTSTLAAVKTEGAAPLGEANFSSQLMAFALVFLLGFLLSLHSSYLFTFLKRCHEFRSVL